MSVPCHSLRFHLFSGLSTQSRPCHPGRPGTAPRSSTHPCSHRTTPSQPRTPSPAGPAHTRGTSGGRAIRGNRRVSSPGERARGGRRRCGKWSHTGSLLPCPGAWPPRQASLPPPWWPYLALCIGWGDGSSNGLLRPGHRPPSPGPSRASSHGASTRICRPATGQAPKPGLRPPRLPSRRQRVFRREDIE